jgi:hypothetical protein
MDPELELALAMSLSLAAEEEEEQRRRKQKEEKRRRQQRPRQEQDAARAARQQEDEEEKQLQMLLDEELAQAVAAVENEDVFRCDEVLAQEATEAGWPHSHDTVRPPPALCRDDSELAAQLATQLNSEMLELDEAVARAIQAERPPAAPAPLPLPLPPPPHQMAAPLLFAPPPGVPQAVGASDFADLESMTPEQLAAFTERLQDVPRTVPTSALARLPEETVTRAVEGEECLVCLEAFEVGDTLRRLPCLHRFHKHCIDTWFQQNNICPECRTEVSRETIP